MIFFPKFYCYITVFSTFSLCGKSAGCGGPAHLKCPHCAACGTAHWKPVCGCSLIFTYTHFVMPCHFQLEPKRVRVQILAHFRSQKSFLNVTNSRVDLALGKIEKMSFFMFLYFCAHNSNPSRHELCVRKFKKLKNDIIYILPYVRPTLVLV